MNPSPYAKHGHRWSEAEMRAASLRAAMAGRCLRVVEDEVDEAA